MLCLVILTCVRDKEVIEIKRETGGGGKGKKGEKEGRERERDS